VVLVIVPGLFFPLIFMVTITGWMLDVMYNFTVVEVGDVVDVMLMVMEVPL
jgi:hypothetical protein